jgi:hypothetical protein
VEKPQEMQVCSSSPAEGELPTNMVSHPPEPEDKITKIVSQDDLKNLPTGAVEIATIAVTEDDDTDILNAKFQDIPDDDLPDILLKVAPTKGYKMPEATPEKCSDIKINWKIFTSTWLSVSAKNINFAEFLPATDRNTDKVFVEPVCEETRVSLRY